MACHLADPLHVNGPILDALLSGHVRSQFCHAGVLEVLNSGGVLHFTFPGGALCYQTSDGNVLTGPTYFKTPVMFFFIINDFRK